MAVGDALVLIPFSRLLLQNLSQRVKYLSKYWFYGSRGHCSILFVQVPNWIWPSDRRFRAHTRVSTYGRWRGFLSKIGVFSSVGKGGKAGKCWCVFISYKVRSIHVAKTFVGLPWSPHIERRFRSERSGGWGFHCHFLPFFDPESIPQRHYGKLCSLLWSQFNIKSFRAAWGRFVAPRIEFVVVFQCCRCNFQLPLKKSVAFSLRTLAAGPFRRFPIMTVD